MSEGEGGKERENRKHVSCVVQVHEGAKGGGKAKKKAKIK